MRFSCNSLRYFAAALAFGLLTAFALTLAATDAAAAGYYARGVAPDNPALGTGYVYWKQERRSKPGPRGLSTKVFQRRLSDGRERMLLELNGTRLSDIFAEGATVAFSMETTRRMPTHKRRGLATDRIYAMAAEDAAPTLLLTANFSTEPGRDGPEWQCGESASLREANADGQILIDGGDVQCARHREVDYTRIYKLDGTPFSKLNVFLDSWVDSIQFGNLITDDSEAVKVVNLATGAKRTLKDHFVTEQVEMSASGWIATVAPKDDGSPDLIRLFPPGASTPSFEVANDIGESSVAFCADGFVEMTEPWAYKGGPMSITYRGLDGQLRSRISGPDARLGYDAVCEGRHLTIALRKWKARPVLVGYDL